MMAMIDLQRYPFNFYLIKKVEDTVVFLYGESLEITPIVPLKLKNNTCHLIETKLLVA